MIPMKRTMLLSCAFAFLCLQTARAQTPLVHPLYPLNVGDKWTYRVIDLKAPLAKADPKKIVVVEVERPEIYGRKNVDKNGKVTIEDKVGFILKSTSGGKTTRDHVIVLEDGFYRIHAAETPTNPPLPFFKVKKKDSKTGDDIPLQLGDTWTCNSVSGNTTIKGTFTLKSERIKALDKMYEAYGVSFNNGKAGKDRVEIDCWYVPNIGLVKQRVLEKEREIGLELESYQRAK
jgi:hypothetical protein